jgi:hypothetical protein
MGIFGGREAMVHLRVVRDDCCGLVQLSQSPLDGDLPGAGGAVGQWLKERIAHAALHEARLTSWLGVQGHQLGGRFAMPGEHNPLACCHSGQQHREMGLGLLHVDGFG